MKGEKQPSVNDATIQHASNPLRKEIDESVRGISSRRRRCSSRGGVSWVDRFAALATELSARIQPLAAIRAELGHHAIYRILGRIQKCVDRVWLIDEETKLANGLRCLSPILSLHKS